MSIFRKYDYWFRSGQYTAIQKLSTLLMGILTFMLLARILGPSGFGVWGLFLTISGIVETARVALIKNAFIRFMNQTDDEEEHSRLQGAAVILSVSISLVLALFFLLLASSIAGWLNAPSLKEMLQWYAVTIVVSSLFTHCEMLLNAKMDFKGVCWMYCVRQGLLVLLLFFFYIAHLQITTQVLALLYLTSVIVGTLVGLQFSRSYLKWEFHHYRSWLPKLWSYGKFVFGTNVSSQLFRSTDNFIASNYFGTSVAAYYNASLRIGNLVDMPSQVLGDVLFPKAAKFNSSDKGSIKHIYERTVGAILVFSIPALLILLLFPSGILHLLAGQKFVEGASILRITAFFGFILPFLKQFGTIMDATGHPDTNFRVMLIAFCINVITNLTGVYFFGIIGAAMGTATTYLIVFIIMQVILHKRFGIRVISVFKNTWSLYGELLMHFRTFYKK